MHSLLLVGLVLVSWGVSSVMLKVYTRIRYSKLLWREILVANDYVHIEYYTLLFIFVFSVGLLLGYNWV